VLLDFLRRTSEPLDAREIASRLLGEAGHEGDAPLLERARETVRKVLRGYRSRGIVSFQRASGQRMLWELTRDA
jgi:hypothetical protein